MCLTHRITVSPLKKTGCSPKAPMGKGPTWAGKPGGEPTGKYFRVKPGRLPSMSSSEFCCLSKKSSWEGWMDGRTDGQTPAQCGVSGAGQGGEARIRSDPEVRAQPPGRMPPSDGEDGAGDIAPRQARGRRGRGGQHPPREAQGSGRTPKQTHSPPPPKHPPAHHQPGSTRVRVRAHPTLPAPGRRGGRAAPHCSTSPPTRAPADLARILRGARRDGPPPP